MLTEKQRGIHSTVINIPLKEFEENYNKAAVTLVAQSAVSYYRKCYVLQDMIPGEFAQVVVYSPENLRRLTLSEIENKGQWYTDGRDKQYI